MISKEQKHDKQSSEKQPSRPAARDFEPIAGQPNDFAATVQKARLHPGSLSPRDVLQLQRIVGNRAVSQLLDARPRSQRMAGVMSRQGNDEATTGAGSGVIQRLLRGADARSAYETLTTGKAGGAPTTAGRAGETLESRIYHSIVQAVDEYEREERALSIFKKPPAWFRSKLDAIENLCNEWFAHNPPPVPDPTNGIASARAKNRYLDVAEQLTYLLGQVRTERARLSLSARQEQASLVPGSLRLSSKELNSASQPGHAMTVTLQIQCPDDPPASPPGTVYGVRFEYWEKIDVEYNFTGGDKANKDAKIAAGEGRESKQWNDIYAFAPTARTFQDYNERMPPHQFSLAEAVARASRRELGDLVTIGLIDKPLFCRPQAGTYGKRVLRFRIVAGDRLGHRQEILAIQIIQVNGPHVARAFFYDTLDVPALVAGGGMEPPAFAPILGIPHPAQLALRGFVTELLTGRGEAFDNQELDQIEEKRQMLQTLPEERRPVMQAPEFYHHMAVMMGPSGSQLAGTYGTPFPQPGQSYKQYPTGVGFLVALMQGGEILKMYYTTGAATSFPPDAVGFNGLPSKEILLLRSFREIPLEAVQSIIEEIESARPAGPR